VLALALGCCLVGLAGAAQFTARTDLVEIYVSVTDASGRPLDGLAREAFHVRDNGIDRSIAAFATGSLPLSMAVVVDRSFSMRGARLAGARAGALALDQRLQPLYEALGVEPNPIPLKWALSHLGFGEADVRLPLTGLNPSHHATVAGALARLEVVEAAAAVG